MIGPLEHQHSKCYDCYKQYVNHSRPFDEDCALYNDFTIAHVNQTEVCRNLEVIVEDLQKRKTGSRRDIIFPYINERLYHEEIDEQKKRRSRKKGRK